MNMNKALQNLYHAVSGSTTTKVNISKLLVDIHYAITGKESENKNNWSKIINSMADNWPEGGGGGGDGYLGLHTATVNVTFDTSEIEGDVTAIQDAYLELGYDSDSGSKAISLSYDDYPNTLLVTDLGSPTEMVVPTSDDYPLWFGLSSVSWRSGDSYVIASDITVVSGDATQGEYSAVITGDCSLNIKVQYQA